MSSLRGARRRVRSLLFLALVLAAPAAALAHGETLVVGVGSSGGTALAASFTPPRVAPVTASFSAGGLTLYSGQFPSFEWATIDTAPPPFPLPTGTQVRMQLVAIDSGASVKIAASTIDAPGESALIGTVAPGEHVHPEWQLTLANGVVGSAVVQFVFTAAGYVTSPTYVVTITNAVADTPTATPTATATATPSATASATDTVPATQDTPTASPTPTAAGSACPPIPAAASCRHAAQMGLLISTAADPARQRLAATWGGGDATDAATFGDPLADTAYALCVYDAQSGIHTLVWSAVIPPGGQCGPRPCWTRSHSGALRYRDRDRSANGVVVIALRPGGDGRSAASVKAIPDSLPSLPLAQDPAVTVRLLSSQGGCWEAVFTAPATRNDGTRFTDK